MDYEDQFEHRKDSMQQIINECAQRDMDEWGAQSEVADELGIGTQRVSYVMNNWKELVEWRRSQMASPLDVEAVKAAYSDETMADMVKVADGAGGVKVDITYELDEVFRIIKLLPGDLGMVTFTQVLQQADRLPKDELAKLLRKQA